MSGPSMSLSWRLILILVLGIITGCSTTGSVTMHESSVPAKAIKGMAVALVVTPSGNDVVIPLRGQVAAQLLGAGLFRSITDESDPNADYKISINLTTIDEVSGVSRVLWGTLAGRNKIAGDVTVIDVRTGQKVRSFSFVGESAAHPFSGKSDIKDAINKAAEEVIKGLVS